MLGIIIRLIVILALVAVADWLLPDSFFQWPQVWKNLLAFILFAWASRIKVFG